VASFNSVGESSPLLANPEEVDIGGEIYRAFHRVSMSNKKGVLYQGSWDQGRSRMYRFDTGSVLCCHWLDQSNFVAPRYLVDIADGAGATRDLILLSIWLSECGKFYFIVYNTTTGAVDRLRARCFINSHMTLNNVEPAVGLPELSRVLDDFICHGKRVEWNDKDCQLKYSSWVLSEENGTKRSSRSDVEPEDLLDHGDQHGFLHYNEVVSCGVPKNWGALGDYYTTIHMGVGVRLQFGWHVNITGHSSTYPRFVFAGAVLPVTASTFAEKQGCLVYDQFDNTIRLANSGSLTHMTEVECPAATRSLVKAAVLTYQAHCFTMNRLTRLQSPIKNLRPPPELEEVTVHILLHVKSKKF